MFELGPAMQGAIPWQADSAWLLLALQRERAKHDPPSLCCTAPISASLMVLICHHGKENPAMCSVTSARWAASAWHSPACSTMLFAGLHATHPGCFAAALAAVQSGSGVRVPPASELRTAMSKPKEKPPGGCVRM